MKIGTLYKIRDAAALAAWSPFVLLCMTLSVLLAFRVFSQNPNSSATVWFDWLTAVMPYALIGAAVPFTIGTLTALWYLFMRVRIGEALREAHAPFPDTNALHTIGAFVITRSTPDQLHVEQVNIPRLVRRTAPTFFIASVLMMLPIALPIIAQSGKRAVEMAFGTAFVLALVIVLVVKFFRRRTYEFHWDGQELHVTSSTYLGVRISRKHAHFKGETDFLVAPQPPSPWGSLSGHGGTLIAPLQLVVFNETCQLPIPGFNSDALGEWEAQVLAFWISSLMHPEASGRNPA